MLTNHPRSNAANSRAHHEAYAKFCDNLGHVFGAIFRRGQVRYCCGDDAKLATHDPTKVGMRRVV